MKVNLLAFVLGLSAALVCADVRDILNNNHHQAIYPSKGQPFAKQLQINHDAGNFNTNNNNNRYWWDTPISPFSNTQPNSISHDTSHYTHEQHQQQPNYQQPQIHTQQHDYSQNPFMQNAIASRQIQAQNFYAQMASLSGSPSEVNNLMTDHNSFAPRYQQRTIPCYGASQVCAPKDSCRNGFISESDLGLVQSQANNCDSQLETCCNIQPNEKFQPQQQQQQSTPCTDANSACVSPKYCFNGFIDQSDEHNASPSTSGFCQSSEVCCQYGDLRSANLILDNEFAAAAQSTSEVLTKEGYVVNVPSNQYLPQRPDPEFNPDASNNDPSRVKPTTAAPAPLCANGAPDSAYPNCCLNGVRNNPYCCANGAQNPTCTVISDEPVQPQPRPTQSPVQPQPRPTQAPYQPNPRPTQGPTQRPVQPQQTQTPYQPQPRPTQGPTQRPVQPQPRPTQRPYQPNPGVNVQDEAIFLPVACAAAMNCTANEYCDRLGRISKTPVDINDPMRVPMTDCLIKESGQPGKCCIDPDYTDPWPVGRTGQYVADELNAVFDDGSYRPDRQNQRKRQVAANSNQVVTRVAPPRRNIARRQNSIPQLQQAASENRNFPAIINAPQSNQIAPINNEKCGIRNLGTQPRGRAPLGTGFGEFTWVAMVILESRKALLCGGAIIHKNLVVTSANCVHGHRHNDVLIKAGEWRLGSDEEPKPFQIVRVQKIIFHPQYQPKTLQNDIALLYLENDIKYDDTHIQPICLDESEAEVSPSEDCVTTGWSKEVLKVHLGNALMQHVKVSVLPQADCQSRLEASTLGYTNSVICGVTQYDACQVDSGSALACADRNGRYVLRGIYSNETNCENPNQIVAFTRTDLQWIREVLRNPSHASRS